MRDCARSVQAITVMIVLKSGTLRLTIANESDGARIPGNMMCLTYLIKTDFKEVLGIVVLPIVLQVVYYITFLGNSAVGYSGAETSSCHISELKIHSSIQLGNIRFFQNNTCYDVSEDQCPGIFIAFGWQLCKSMEFREKATSGCLVVLMALAFLQ